MGLYPLYIPVHSSRFVDASEQYEGEHHNLHNNKLFKCMQHSISLFEPSNNDTPVTFGLWSTLVSSLTYNRLGNGLPRRNDTESLNLLEPLKAIGLDLNAIPYT